MSRKHLRAINATPCSPLKIVTIRMVSVALRIIHLETRFVILGKGSAPILNYVNMKKGIVLNTIIITVLEMMTAVR